MERQKRSELSSRILNRVGSVFRRASRRTRSRVSSQPIESSRSAESRTVAAPASPTVGTVDISTTDIVPASSDPAPPPSTTHTGTQDVSTSGPEPDTTRTVLWSEIQQEKTRKLFAKYGLTLEPQEWMTPSDLQVQRVEKPIKMRVRRRCHRCQTTFGSDKICNNCQHARCKSCPRYPPARTKEEKEARVLARAKDKSPEKPPSEPPKPALTTTPTPTQNPKNTRSILSKDSHFDGRDVIYGRPEQMTGVSSDNKNVPMERPLRVWRRPRMRVRYYCHNCDTMYAQGENLCTECGEAKGPQTRREPPKKTKPPIDEEVLKRVQERLAQFNLAADNT